MVGVVTLVPLLLLRAHGLTRWVETQRLNRSSVAPGYFGVSVGVSDSLIVVGGTGGAYKFHRDGREWTQLSVSPGATTNVAIDGDVMLVGRTTGTTTVYVNEAAKQRLTGTVVAVRGDTALIATDYAVYALFYLEGAWTERGIVISTDSASVALSSMAVIGSGNVVRNYVRVNDRWFERAVLREDDAVDYGRAVAIDGYMLAVGALDAVYVYGKASFSLGWELISRVCVSPSASGRFGGTVGVSSNLVVVGALGSAYVYTASLKEKKAKQVAKLSPSTERDDTFGVDVYVRGGVVVVGAPGHNSVYVYEGEEDDDNKSSKGAFDGSSVSYQLFAAAASILLLVVAVLMCFNLRRRRMRRRSRRESSHQRQFVSVHADTRVFGDDALPIAGEVELLAAKQTAPSCDTPVAQSPTTLFADATFAVDIVPHDGHSGEGNVEMEDGSESARRAEDADAVFLDDFQPSYDDEEGGRAQ